MVKTRWDDAALKRLRELTYEGKSNAAIAIEFGVSEEAIKSVRKRESIPSNNTTGRKRNDGEEQPGCKFNPRGVVCAEQNICHRCGWNPEVQNERLKAWRRKQLKSRSNTP